jgi:hypothetical protein
MNLKKTLSKIGIENSFYECISPGWDVSVAAIPEKIDFLEMDEIRENMCWCKLPTQYSDKLERVASAIKINPDLKAICWHCFQQLYVKRDIQDFSNWPQVSPFPTIYLLIALAMVPLVREKHCEMGIEKEVTSNTCIQVKCFCESHISLSETPGIPAQKLYWLRHYIDGKMFRLGRMEYRLETLKNFGKVFQNKKNGQLTVFSPPGVCYNKNGLVALNDQETGLWQSIYQETEKWAVGNPISPYGYALNEKIDLLLEDWKCILREGDLVLDMHIPSGGGMTPEACIDSMHNAVIFFESHFPEQKSRAIMCRSWIFNTQFEAKLPDSNLAKFMRELYLFPIPSNGRDGMFFVFGRDFDDLNQAPRNTSLQRAMLDILEKEPLRNGGMFILKQDLPHFGSQYYRNRKLLMNKNTDTK